MFRYIRPYARTAATAAALGVLAVLALHPALPAFAQDLGLDKAASIGLTTTDIRTLISNIIRYFLGFLGLLAVILMMYGGYQYMISQGDQEKVQKAKQTMVSATIGLVIIMMAYAIAAFVFSALGVNVSGGLTGGAGGCPTGQTCSLGGGGTGGSGGFRVTNVVPSGPGTDGKGWPKNYALAVWLNAGVAAGSVTPASVEVRKCNARVNGSGVAQAFTASSCGQPITGTRTVEGNKIIFHPDATAGANPTDFEGNFWYWIRVQGSAIRDANGRTLVCPFMPAGEAGDISSPKAQRDLCDRAAAFNDERDASAPTVSVDAPKSPPSFCGTAPIPVHASAQDDYMVAGIDFLLDGGTAGLIDDGGAPASNVVNGSPSKGFSGGVFADLATLNAGSHRITSTASDGVPQTSSPSELAFTVAPANCCNAIKDDKEGETGVDCGGACGACSGGSCTNASQCASGYCGASGKCEDKPIIDAIGPQAAGTGALITITGRFLGSSPGTVTFLGGDGAADDKTATSCMPDAWSPTQIVVAVPAGALTGPIRITTAASQSDDSNDDRGPNLGAFNVNGEVLPGICFANPKSAAPGAEFYIQGAGFGDAVGSSSVAMGAFNPTVSTGGWTASKVTMMVPAAEDKTYPLTVTVNGKTSNTVQFSVNSGAGGTGASSAPHIVTLSPTSGPVGSYVTIQGTGFGRLKGSVWFQNGTNKALALDPVCSDNWKDNYVTVKVPSAYTDGSLMGISPLPGTPYKIKLTTPAPFKSSNDDLMFFVTNEPSRPGICSISPDNGRPGKSVTITGEGFGSPTVSGTAGTGPDSAPRYSVDFSKGGSDTVSATAYASWQSGAITTI
ncbi:MAG: hypothetical protein RLZZ324_199, partial [Candidatus Parcubacteria bacterium]